MAETFAPNYENRGGLWTPDYDKPWTEQLDDTLTSRLRDIISIMDALDAKYGPDDVEQGYEFFKYPEDREELYDYSKAVAEYVHDNDIADLVIVDRSSRPLYIGVREYWKAKYGQDNMPGIYFINPKGFKSIEDTSRSDALKAEDDSIWKDDKVEGLYDQRPRAEILDELKSVYKNLLTDKDKPVLVFDSCLHTGDTLAPVKSVMEEAGFSQLRFGVVNRELSRSANIETDFQITDRVPAMGCYPFDRDRMIEKTFNHVYSEPNADQLQRQEAAQLRYEIRRIVKDEIALDPDIPAEYSEPSEA